ncbi:5347_t:CDS:1, partial [Racocetra persica]
ISKIFSILSSQCGPIILKIFKFELQRKRSTIAGAIESKITSCLRGIWSTKLRLSPSLSKKQLQIVNFESD